MSGPITPPSPADPAAVGSSYLLITVLDRLQRTMDAQTAALSETREAMLESREEVKLSVQELKIRLEALEEDKAARDANAVDERKSRTNLVLAVAVAVIGGLFSIGAAVVSVAGTLMQGP